MDESIQPGPGALDSIPVDESRKWDVPRDHNRTGFDPVNHRGSGLD
jgi:hypothetical protein